MCIRDSTSYDTINFKNHGFSSGEIVEYSSSDTIQGLSTTTSYIVKKINDDTFKISNAGVGGTSTSDYERGNYVNLTSTGSGYQIFKYPDIKVNIEVSYGSTVTGTFNLTPVVTGEIIDTYVYDKGSNYGSTILNHQVKPDVDILTGKNGEIRPIIVNGRIDNVAVVNRGEEYFSTPDLEVSDAGTGSGAIVRPVLENGRIIDAIVINAGIGYSSLTTDIDAVSYTHLTLPTKA